MIRPSIWIAGWGVLAVAATFVEAIARLGGRACRELSGDVTAGQWAALIVLTIMMAYVEGYRALQRRFVPSVVARAHEAARSQRHLWWILAPLYALSLVGAPSRTIARVLVGIAMIVICVLLVRELPTPWRGICDGAVAVALAWGLISLIACFAGTVGSVRSPAADIREAT